MDKVSGRLTVFSEKPFWIGVFERISEGKLSVCKVTSEAEPKDYEVYDFVLKNYYQLNFSSAVATDVKEADRNPKRLQRESRKQVQNTGIGMKSQQALKLQQEQLKTECKTVSREQWEAEKQRQFELKQQLYHTNISKRPDPPLSLIRISRVKVIRICGNQTGLINLKPLYVGCQRPADPILISHFQKSYNLRMLLNGAFQYIGVLDEQNAEPVIMPVPAGNGRPCHLLIRHIKQNLMKLIIRIQKAHKIPGFRTPLLKLDQLRHLADIALVLFIQKHIDHTKLQTFPDELFLFHTFHVDPGDNRLPLRNHLNQSFRLQLQKRFPHRCPADIQFRGDFLRTHRLPRLQLHGHNISLQFLVDQCLY